MEGHVIFELILLIIITIIARVLFLVHKITTGHSRYEPYKRKKPCKTLICIGSGGHTTEMLRLLNDLDFDKYTPRSYVMSNNDTTSLRKIEELERIKNKKHYKVYKIPRSRSVHQSYLTSIFSTIYSILYSIPIVLWIKPDLVLCNGPGTCIPVCGICFLLKVAFVKDVRIVYVESFCRTKTLSLTGKILAYFADNFIVQWPNLRRKLKRADYIGQLM